MRISSFISKGAMEIVKALNPNVLMIVKADPSKPDYYDLEVIRDETVMVRKMYYKINVEKLPPASFSLFRYLIISAIDNSILRENDYVFCIADKSMGMEFDGMFLFFKIDDSFMDLSRKKLEEEVNQNVFRTVLEIAKEIGRQGREGKKVGTSFIIGDSTNVLLKSTQMVINPFKGYPASERNILDPRMKETVKNFALLDGAFVISDTGSILAAGRYLNPSTSVSLPGLGARHQSAAAITAETKAVAVVVSESGGIVRVFRKGRLVMEIDPNQEEEVELPPEKGLDEFL